MEGMVSESIVNILIPKMTFRHITLRNITEIILDEHGLTDWTVENADNEYAFHADIGPDTLVHAIRSLADNFLLNVYFDEEKKVVRFEKNLRCWWETKLTNLIPETNS
jgi:hypothetical protein